MDKLTVSTTQLQAMLAKAVRGAGNNKLIPMTSLVVIEAKDGNLTLTTTDKTNYLRVRTELEGGDFYAVVNIELLAKLVAKMTSETTTLELTDKYLNVIGNGKYQIDLPLDEDGEKIVLPNPISPFDEDEKPVGKVNSSTIANILASIKSALLTTMDYPWYTCYYVGENDTLATDTYTVGSYAKGFLNTPNLVSSEAMDLVGLLLDDIEIYIRDNKMLFWAKNGCVLATIPDGADRFSVEDIRTLVEQDFDYSCKIAKTSMLNLLDRISLFVGVYDNGEITLTFTKDGLEVTSKYANEKIKYAEEVNIGDFTCKTDINTLTAQIKSQLGGTIELQYGRDNAIKLIDGDVTSVVALLEE